MYRSYKIEIKPTKEQILKIHKTIGVCKFIYNLYLTKNKEEYELSKQFISAFTFSKWLNNEFIKNNPSYSWIKEVSSKAIKQSITNAERAYKKFFKEKTGFPKYKKKSDTSVKIYLPKNNKTDFTIERHRIKIPTFGFIRLKEFGYIPLKSKIKSGTIFRQANKYYISVLCEIKENTQKYVVNKEGIGIDLGIKNFAICSDGRIFSNINKTEKIKKLEQKLRREQRKLSKKLLMNKKNKNATSYININKNRLQIQILNMRLSNIRKEYVRFVVNSLVKVNNLPKFISIEDLNVSHMLKNKYLSKSISEQLFYYFRVFLIQQCKKYGVEVRIVDRFYPSSKTCYKCGSIKKDSKLSEREFRCECKNIIDRDYQASLNLRDCKIYKIA